MKANLCFILCITAVILFCSCNGPRYIYSSSPLVSPVAGSKGSTSIDAAYFSHINTSNGFDSTANKDNAFSFDVSNMLTKKIKFFVHGDFKREKNIFPLLTDSAAINIYNGGFDSASVATQRQSAGLGIVYFFNSRGRGKRIVPGIAGSVYLHQVKLKESGLLANNSYERFFNANQLSFSLQGHLLFKINKRINVTYITRIILVKFMTAKTDFTKEEKEITGLHRDGKSGIYPCFIGGYASYQPLRNIPLYCNFQFFNDVALWAQATAKYDPPRSNIKGSGVAIGLSYSFKK
ncbi:MAG: hypothetical protein H7Y86_15150 [Rhizobacter sp.]|nr:hypothetical protein [Ferruginibacter sp.]